MAFDLKRIGVGPLARASLSQRKRHVRIARQGGGMSPTTMLLLVIISCSAAAAGWWFLSRSSQDPGALLPNIVATTPTAPSGSTAPTNVASATESSAMSVDQLYTQARQAMSENRMVAPAGNNALEYYLQILAKQPDDSAATDALRELFPFATGNVEDQINQGNFDEATRVMTLLAKADPGNYSLTILRGKLDAKRKQNDRDQQQQAEAEAARTQATANAAAAAASRAAAAATAANAPPVVESTSSAGATGANATAAAKAPSVPPAAVPLPKPAVPPPTAPVATLQSRDAKPLVPARPVYPTRAARNHQEGWVEVEFTVTPDGSVQDARVIASNPSRLFDRAALDAIGKATYEPRIDNGVAVAAKLRRRIEFKLN